MIKAVEEKLGITFPSDFAAGIRQYDGGYPFPNKITVEGEDEVLNNLISFCEGDVSYILDIFNDTEYFSDFGLVPIAEDPFGNLFCYSFGENSYEIVFWCSEETQCKHVCGSFDELIAMLHE